MSILLKQDIPAQERLIMALDVPTVDEAKHWVNRMGSQVSFYKIGLELLMSGHYFSLLDWLVAQEKKVFVDLKFFDVPETVRSAIRNLSNSGASFATIHGNQSIMEAASKDKGDLKVLAVTVLTSLDRGDLQDMGFECDVEKLVVSRARRAFEAGCDGVISSGLEVPMLRQEVDHKLMVICPGIRPVDNKPSDDQKRTVDVAQAFNNGADYIVVGRPIRQAEQPEQLVEQMQTTIQTCFS